MSLTVKHQIWIVLAVAAVVFTNLGAPRLWDEDEPRNAACAREMMARGDWITPTFNGQLRIDKPVLLYWLMRSSYAVFGPTEFAARFWSAVLAIGTSLCTYHLGRILFRAEAGLWAALAVGTALMFDIAGRAATPDSTLIFCTTLSLLLFVRGSYRGREQTSAAELSRIVPRRWLDFGLMYAAMGLAVLAKGPVGFVLPCGVIGLYLMWINQARPETDPRPQNWLGWYDSAFLFLRRMLSPRNFLQSLWAMRPLTLIAVVAAIALPWYVAVGIQTDGQWLKGFLGTHNLDRFRAPMEGHRGGIFFYVPAILIGFFPWSIFLPLTLWEAVRRIRAHHVWRPGYVLLMCWVGLYVALFSLAGTKLPSYVLPAYPALALLTGAFIDHALSARFAVNRWAMRAAFVTVALVGIGCLIGLPIALGRVLPGESLLGLVGLAPLVGAIVVLALWERGRLQQAITAMAVTAVVFSASLFGGASVRVSRYQNSAPLVETIRQAGGEDAQIATFAYLPSSLVFYAGHVEVCRKPDEVRRFFETDKPAYLVTLDESLDRVLAALPADVVVLDRQPRFLKQGEEVVLLGRTSPQRRVATEPKTEVPRR